MSQADAAAPTADAAAPTADEGTGESAATMHYVSDMLSNVARETNTAETAVIISNSTENQPTMVHMNEVARLAAEIAEKSVKQILDSLRAPFLFGGTCESAAATALTDLMGAAGADADTRQQCQRTKRIRTVRDDKAEQSRNNKKAYTDKTAKTRRDSDASSAKEADGDEDSDSEPN